MDDLGVPIFQWTVPKIFYDVPMLARQKSPMYPHYAKYHVYMMKQMANSSKSPNRWQARFLRLVNLKMIQNIDSGGFNQKKSGIWSLIYY